MRIPRSEPRLRAPHRRMLACALAGLLGTAACGAPAAAPPSPPAPAASSGAAGFFGGTDLAWVEINIAMNEQLLPLLELAPAHSDDQAVRAYAAQLAAATNDELSALRRLHDEAQLPAQNPHEGMPMPGMVTPEQVTAAAATRGPAFDKLLVEHVKAHLAQRTSLAGSEQKAGLEPRTKALADTVLTNNAGALKDLPSPA
jgi:uncharacterized protein (DUF305 family)